MGLRPALFWFSLISILAVTWKLLDLPSDAEMVEIIKDWLLVYGLALVFLGSLLETLLFIGFYFPGSFIIFLSVALSSNVTQAVFSILMVSLGMICGYCINYFLGRYGWYKLLLKFGMRSGILNAQVKMQKNDLRYVFYTYWNPGLASFTSTAAGILKLKFSRFIWLSVSALALWNTFWGIVAYSVGESVVNIISLSLVLKIILVWLLFEVILLIWKKFFKRKIEVV